MDSKLHFRCCLGVQASNYIVSHMYVTHLQLLSWSLFIQAQRPEWSSVDTASPTAATSLHFPKNAPLVPIAAYVSCITLPFVRTVSFKRISALLGAKLLTWRTPMCNTQTHTEGWMQHNRVEKKTTRPPQAEQLSHKLLREVGKQEGAGAEKCSRGEGNQNTVS